MKVSPPVAPISPSYRTCAGEGPARCRAWSGYQVTRPVRRLGVVVFVADRLSTVTVTCGVGGLAHEVTEENVAAGRRLGNRQYRAICGYRFPLPPPLVTLTGRPCARCAAVLVRANQAEPATGRVRHSGHRQPGWWWRILHPGRDGGAGARWRP